VTTPRLTPEQLNQYLSDAFSPWVMDLDLSVIEASETKVKLRMRPSERLNRHGDMVSGQALMAAADTAMVVAVFCACGEFTPCSTVDMSSSFLKPATNVDLIVTARLIRKGRTLVFVRSEIVSSKDDKAVLSATGTYALPGGS